MSDTQQAPGVEAADAASASGVRSASWARRNLAILVPWTLSLVLGVTLLLVLLDPFSEQAEPSAAQSHDVSVTFVLYDGPSYRNDCFGEGGYSDISPGTPVTLRNGEGDIVGAGSLGTGSGKRDGIDPATCTYTTSFSDVPSAAFYSVEVSDRGEITQAEAELAANGFEFEVSLGP